MADDRLYFTGDDEANALLARDPVALLIGFALDQQVSVPKAFSGPLELERRLGTLDPGRIAATDPAELDLLMDAGYTIIELDVFYQKGAPKFGGAAVLGIAKTA